MKSRQLGKESSSQLSHREERHIYPYFNITGISFSGKKTGSTPVSQRMMTGFSALKMSPALQGQSLSKPKFLSGTQSI